MRAEELTMPFGKHDGRLVWDVVLHEADYIYWLYNRSENDGFEWLDNGIADLVDRFDNTPIMDGCCGKVDGEPCQRQATRFSLYRGRTEPMFWCEECDPLQTGVGGGSITIGRGYYHALEIVHTHRGSWEMKRDVIRNLAQAKRLMQTRSEVRR